MCEGWMGEGWMCERWMWRGGWSGGRVVDV